MLSKQSRKRYYIELDTRLLTADNQMAIEPAHGATSDEELVDRILLRYTNEAALCIQEEVIRTPQVRVLLTLVSSHNIVF